MIAIGTSTVFVLFAVGVATYHFRNKPYRIIERILNARLPKSAGNIQLVIVRVPDSKIVKLWAVMDVDLENAGKLALDLGVPTDSYDTFLLPKPEHPMEGWVVFDKNAIAVIPSKWVKRTPSLNPAVIGMLWNNGKLYVYFHGVERHGATEQHGVTSVHYANGD